MTTKKRMAIISSYFEGESYGLLGPQMAATIIEQNTDYECIVIAVTRDDDKSLIKKFFSEYFGNETTMVGFSSLSGREDLFAFAKELKDEGAITILAGPQAYPDYIGEVEWPTYPHRFKGLSNSFTLSLRGPAEQAIPLLKNFTDKKAWDSIPGITLMDKEGIIIDNTETGWNEAFLKSMNWNNLYKMTNEGLVPVKITTGQVLQQIGCPHAGRGRLVEIDYPEPLRRTKKEKVAILSKGCSFCDVARDKGFYGELGMETVLAQIAGLPELEENRKIPFELINENPLFTLSHLLKEANGRGIRMSQINLILRGDYFLKGESRLRESLKIAGEIGVRIVVSSMGFEAFDDTLLANFNKGIDVETNLKAITLMRQLKEEFPGQWGYSNREGSIHGFIHPTPWDSDETAFNTQRNIAVYGLERDILPPHSTPLIIHHACALADWTREVEKREGIIYKRHGTIIGWWDSTGVFSSP
jgi:hypothetical protein